MRRRRLPRPIVAAASIAVAGCAVALTGATTPIERTVPTCESGAYAVYARSLAGPSRLARLDLATGRTTDVADLSWRVNALGFAETDGRFYGLAEPAGPGRTRVLAIDATGDTTDLGPLRGSADPLFNAFAGTVGGRWFYVLDGDRLYVVDLDPHSQGYLAIDRTVALSRPVSLGDWDLDPTGEGLWGVEIQGAEASVVRVDVPTGTVTTYPVSGLPPGSLYGSALVAPGPTLYVVVNNTGDKRRTLRMPLRGQDPPGPVEQVGKGDAWATSDAAYCPGQIVAPAPSPTSAPPASPTPAPAPPPPVGVEEPPALAVPPPPSPTTPPPPPIVEPLPARVPPVVPRVPPVAARDDRAKQAKRWTLVAAVAVVMSGLLGVRAMSGRRR